MARLTLRQILFAIVLGAVVAALQGEAPVPALNKLANVGCITHAATHC